MEEKKEATIIKKDPIIDERCADSGTYRLLNVMSYLPKALDAIPGMYGQQSEQASYLLGYIAGFEKALERMTYEPENN